MNKRFAGIVAHASIAAAVVTTLAVANMRPASGQDDGGRAGAMGGGEAGVAPALPAYHPLADLDMEKMMAEGMAQWMEAGQPGPQHEFLAEHFAGEWDIEQRVWMDPSGEPMEMRAREKSESIFGGRYIATEFRGTFMGQPMTGRALLGYDNVTKQFVQMWVDNFSTGISVANGSMSMDGKTLSLIGTMNEPLTGELGKPVRYLYEIDGPDRHTFSIWEMAYGEPMKVMEMVYTRRR